MDVHICMFHILAVIHMYDTASPSPCNSEFLSALIIQSQTLMRDYALRELKEAFAYRPNTATVTNLAHCCVSQRDIQVCCCVLLPLPLSVVCVSPSSTYVMCYYFCGWLAVL